MIGKVHFTCDKNGTSLLVKSHFNEKINFKKINVYIVVSLRVDSWSFHSESFIHSFIQQIISEYLLCARHFPKHIEYLSCARHFSRHLGYISEKNRGKSLFLYEIYIEVGQSQAKTRNKIEK